MFSEILFLLHALAGGVQPAPMTEVPEEIPLCKLLASPKDYRGRLVHVAGTIIWDRDSYALRAEDCGSALRIGEYTWTPAVCLRTGAGNAVGGEATGDAKRSLDLYGAAMKLYEKEIRWTREMEVTVSLIGRVEARPEYVAIPLAGGGYGLNGYCHLNAFPAVLHYSEATEWTIRITHLQAPTGAGANSPPNRSPLLPWK